MSNGNLRIYYGPEGEPPVKKETKPPAQVTINAGELFSLLRSAVAANCGWLSDFEDDQVTLTADLYEVLQAHQKLHRPSA